MSYTVVVLPKARDEWERIITWIEQRSPAGADRLWASLAKGLKSLEKNPEACGLAPETGTLRQEIRQLLFRTRRGLTYRALFDIRGLTVRVLRIRGPGQQLLDPGDLTL